MGLGTSYRGAFAPKKSFAPNRPGGGGREGGTEIHIVLKEGVRVFLILDLWEAYIPNLSLLASQEGSEKFLVGGLEKF